MKVKMREAKRETGLATEPLRDKWQGAGESQDAVALFGRRSDEFKTVHETRAVPNHRSQHERFGHVGNRKLKRNHFSRNQRG
jgi:hypothetical protein